MPVFDNLEKAAFAQLTFAVKEVRVKCTYKHYTHKYLRVPGGVNEKLERDLYLVEMDAVFDVNVKGYGTDYWPGRLRALRDKFDRGETAPLLVPTIGTIPAFMPEWDQTAKMGERRSGELVKLKFLEDQTELFLTQAAAKVQQSNLESAAKKFEVTAAAFALEEADKGLVDKIQDAANKVLAYRDQSELYGGLLAAKVGVLTQLLQEGDRTLQAIKQPLNQELLEAMLELWETAVDLGRELAFSPRGPDSYVVPRVMSVSEISNAIYRTTERANEIMLNNRFSDPFAVPAGTAVIYFVN